MRKSQKKSKYWINSYWISMKKQKRNCSVSMKILWKNWNHIKAVALSLCGTHALSQSVESAKAKVPDVFWHIAWVLEKRYKWLHWYIHYWLTVSQLMLKNARNLSTQHCTELGEWISHLAERVCREEVHWNLRNLKVRECPFNHRLVCIRHSMSQFQIKTESRASK